MIHLHLTDSRHRVFPVHIYTTCYPEEDGSIAYLIGIAEPGERTFPEDLPADQIGNHENLSPVMLGRGSSGPSSEGTSATSEKELDDQLQEVAVTVCDDDEFTIMGCTP